ncbi:GDSL lipase/esterase protein [Dioscorea alata]|uniref:GDSL lipase/esterase protein n=1 Tax=Dioscorea alata TaxID=55571 RepID=A0ACB7VUR3_DIOAL|nr:GDSL lipase/esterase protein [Dioscorea alata]
MNINVVLALLVLLVLLLFSSPSSSSSFTSNYGVKNGSGYCEEGGKVIFNFGDSNSDTGGLFAGLGIYIPLPEGRVFFRQSTGRLCDGRLIIDFLCESLNRSYLSAYMEALGSDFSNGANFAISGSSTLPRNTPFNLYIQIHQFIHFKSKSLQLIAQGSKGLVDEHGFDNALYTIDIGQNDLAGAFSSNKTYDEVIERIPLILSEIESAIKTLYDNGVKNFWVHNTGPLGCLPQKLALPRKDDGDIDQYGCLKTLNNAAREFNSRLSALCDNLRSNLNNVTIVYNDIFSIKYDLVANYTKYGFASPVMACCGLGGPPYNYDLNNQCGSSTAQACADGSKYISWDGVHYTEAANAIVAAKILSTDYSKPALKFDYFCNA